MDGSGKSHFPHHGQALQPFESDASWQGWRMADLQAGSAGKRLCPQGRKGVHGGLLDMAGQMSGIVNDNAKAAK